MSELQDKVVMMPRREEMIQKLRERERELYGETPQGDRFLNRFVKSVADSEKVGAGLALAWELAAYDTLREYPPVVSFLLTSNFDAAVEAITPDPEVVNQAKEFRKAALEAANKKQG